MTMAAKNKAGEPGVIKIQYYRSAIGFSFHQKLIVKGLGFRKLNCTREIADTPSARGMVAEDSASRADR